MIRFPAGAGFSLRLHRLERSVPPIDCTRREQIASLHAAGGSRSIFGAKHRLRL